MKIAERCFATLGREKNANKSVRLFADLVIFLNLLPAGMVTGFCGPVS